MKRWFRYPMQCLLIASLTFGYAFSLGAAAADQPAAGAESTPGGGAMDGSSAAPGDTSPPADQSAPAATDPSAAGGTVPGSVTAPAGDAGTAAAAAATGTGTGLTGEYYDNNDFTNLKLVRIDPTVNFDYGSGSPDPTIGADDFSVRWSGKVQPQYSEAYTFITKTDDGVRLWVNGQLLIDKWIGQAPTEWSGTIDLIAGEKYDIKMEYYEGCCGAFASLSWSSASQPKQIIPASQLYPVETNDTEPPSVPQNLRADFTAYNMTQLSWDASTDNSFLSRYEILQNGALIGSPSQPNFTVVGLSAETAYTFSVRAVDVAGNTSAESAPLTVTTPAYSEDPAPGVLLARDSFDGQTGPLHASSAGRGWGGSWQVQNNDVSVPGFNVADVQPLAYADLYARGNYATGGKAYLTSTRQLDLSASGPFANYLTNGKIGKAGETLWISALLRKDANNDETAYIGLDWPDTKLEAGYFGASSKVGSTRYWSLNLDGKVYTTDKPVVIGEAALLVLKLEFGQTNVVSLYVNPPGLGGPAPQYPSVAATTAKNIAFSKIEYGGGGGGTGQHSMDEVRVGSKYGIVTPTFFDDQAPAAPAALTLVKKNDSAVTFTWTASTDNVGVTGYRVYAGDTLMATTTDTSIQLKGLTKATTYALTVRAEDAENNLSAPSPVLEVTMDAEPADKARYNFENADLMGWKTIEGSAVVALDTTRAYAGESSVKVTWTGAANQTGIGVENPDPLIKKGKKVYYQVYIPAGQPDFAIQPFVFGAGWTWNGGFYETKWLEKDKWVQLEVPFTNGDSPGTRLGMNIHSTTPVEFWLDSVTYTGYGEPDTQAPAAPGGLKATSMTDNVVNIAWNASSDNIEVTGYEVYVGDTAVGTTKATSFAVSGLTADTTYAITVKAFDEAKNKSEASAVLTVTTETAHSKLSGQPFGTPSANNDANTTFDKAFDGNPATYFNAADPNAGYAGIDLGEGVGKRLSKLKFMPRSGSTAKMTGGKFQGSKTGELNDYTTLYIIRSTPSEGWNELKMNDPRAFRYFRYVGPANSSATVAEIEFYGVDGDITPPSAPTVEASGQTETTISLSWQPSTDNVGVTEYVVYQDGALSGRTTETSYTVKDLEPNRTYTFTVRAKDGAEQLSADSNPVTVTTNAADLVVHTKYSVLTHVARITGTISSGRGQEVTVIVKSPSGESIYVGQATSAFGGKYAVQFKLTSPAAGDYAVIVGGVGVNLKGSGVLRVTDTDTEPPTAPSDLTASNVTYTSLKLRWGASSDNEGIAGYDIRQDGVKIGSTKGTTFNVTNLWPGTTYSFTVVAKDVFGNTTESPALEADTLPPTKPTGSVSINGGAALTNDPIFTLTLEAQDELSHTVKSMRFSENGEAWSDWVPFAQTHQLTLTTGDGERTVFVQFLSGYDGISDAYSDSIVFDTTGPVITFTGYKPEYKIDEQINISCTITDAVSGVASSECPGVSGPAYKYWPGSHSVTATATDIAGNTSTETASFKVVITLDSLINLIKQLVQSEEAKQLLSKLQGLVKQLEKDNPKAANALLNTYVRKVNDLQDSGLTAEQKQLLIDAAKQLKP